MTASPQDAAKSDSEFLKATNYSGFRVEGGWKPIIMVRGDGMQLEDEQGRKYLDFSSQPSAVNLGHNNKHIMNAIKAQADKLAYVGVGFGTDVRVEFTKRLQQVVPENLVKFNFGNSGSEANEAAVKMVRTYFAREGRTKIITRYNSYHGWTAAATQLTGGPRRMATETTGAFPGIVHVPDPYCYRCPFGLKYPECNVACVEFFDYAIKNEGNVGAVMVEPVTGASGVVVPPKEYLPRLREITEENDVLLIADEVLTGWGRTGEWFGVDNWGVKPDMLTTAKGISGGQFPLAMTATNGAIAEFFEKNWFPLSGTFSAHPLGMAAGIAAIEEYQKDDLIPRAKEMGTYLGKRLEELKSRHRSVGDVRGLGMLWALELVKNRKTKEPFDTPQDYLAGKTLMVSKVASKMMSMGIFVYTGVVSHLIISPPLIVNMEQLDRCLGVLDQALAVSDGEADPEGQS
ncbi:MAG: aspartate aminotransferase family protein [Thaumarchaeota archaeon]|nr:aspartate aminotransferase family protein [Nitrososphaerota archaeon]